MPKVSVIVPCYNHARFLRRRMDSILGQTFRDFDVIAVDDASQDGSVEILRGYARDPRVRLILNSVRGGSAFKTWNTGARAASGELLWIAESDDYADQHFLEALAPRMERSPEVGLAYCRSFLVNDRDEILGTDEKANNEAFGGHWLADYQGSGLDEIANYLVFRNTIPNASAVLMRSRLFARIGLAAEEMALAGDWHVWVRLLQHGDISYCATPLNYFRRHEGTIRESMSGRIAEVAEHGRIIEHVFATMGLPQTQMDAIMNFFLEKWWGLLRRSPGEAFSRKNAAVYRRTARYDPHLRSRIAKTLLFKARKALGGNGQAKPK